MLTALLLMPVAVAQATISTSTSLTGRHHVRAVFDGDTVFAPSEAIAADLFIPDLAAPVPTLSDWMLQCWVC